ncbi:cytochrome P450 2K4-like [Boleophthalmus pectinirostris]|uniref:cytochrome P450 2K4-like n=1 Tax=Boleophthalmus pectinirostris TaxID=150288 RepID=UPI002432B208|nr:cytochrome P450 2K4-like [Boleophthalmus pectinirostris]
MGVLSEFFFFVLSLFSPVSVLGFVLFLLVVYFISSNPAENEPPGPRPLPVFGNLLQLNLRSLHTSLWELSKKYGSVLTVWMGPNKWVILVGYKTVKEALVTHAEVFGERASTALMRETSNGHGLIWSNGERWRDLRRFAITNLRDFGMGKKACEDKITEECGHLVDVLQNYNGKAFDTMQTLNYSVSNIICSLVYGSRFQYQDPQFTTMVDLVNKRIQLASTPPMLLFNMFPSLGRWIKNRQKLKKIFDFLKDQNRSLFKGLRETLNPQMCRGFVDAFMVKQKAVQESGVTDSVYNEENLLHSVLSLFAAGTETTSTTLRWGLLLMAKYPHIQDRVREEIFRVIGSRQVQTEDRRDMPFTDAVIHETQRFGNIAPMALPHKTSQDITFQGHFIKKGTQVWPLLTSVLYDESEWEKPHSFYPDHFLDKDGKFRKRDAFMPFSAGRRICLGEGLARMELFIFFVTLMQRFRFTAPPGVSEEELDLTPSNGLTLSPRPHQLCAVSLA